MLNKTEMLNLNRKKMLIGCIIGFSVWQGSRTIISLIPGVENVKSILLSIIMIGLIGWGYWAFYLFKMLKIMRELKQNPLLAESLNDEFYKHIRLKSFTIGFWILLITQSLLFFINMTYALPFEAVFNINILAGVLSPLIAFILYDHE